MSRTLAFVYGLVSYGVFLGAFLYAIGFVGNLLVPKSIDTGASAPFGQALLINAALLGLFAVQHSGMARPGFKRWWTRIVPRPIERSTYVLLASLALILLFWQWRPLPAVVWDVQLAWARGLLWALFGLGWGLVLIATFMISHAHLFGLKQVYEHLRREQPPSMEFQTPGLYLYLRHPIMLGFFIAFWATPTMTVGHLIFAIATTGYILLALQLEERDLLARFGRRYEDYRARVPMFLPWPRGKASSEAKQQRQQARR
jgi:methanethiol S-methyltransferase